MPSPVIKSEKVTMSFGEALIKATEGERFTKIEWEDTNVYGFIREGVLHLHKEDGDHKWIINDGDILGNDYILIESN